jgi:outer membrane protein TolC
MKIVLSMLSFTLILNASSPLDSLTLPEAIEILQTQNLEIKAASLDVDAAASEADSISGMNWGSLDFTQDFARSNDAGNVFGFKLSSREAAFGDFGAQEFMTNFMSGNPNYTTPPRDLNYPEDRNFFQSKLKYQVPLFTGFAISSYTQIMDSMKKMKTLEKEQITNEKIFQLRKSYYDMALLNDSIINLEKILENITSLEEVTGDMINEGYAKKVDLLEVKAKKGNVERLLLQMHANKKLLYHYISFLLNKRVDNIALPNADIAMPAYDDANILSNNLDIKKAATGLEIRKSMVSASEASQYPTLGAFAEVSTADDTFLGDAADHKAYTVGARLSWNLFNGGIDSAKIEKSKIEQMKMHSQAQLAHQGIALELAKVRTEIQSADEEIASLHKELLLVDTIYENYLGRYKEKLASMSDVIMKHSEHIEKILQLQMAKNSRNEKIFALEKLANGELK